MTITFENNGISAAPDINDRTDASSYSTGSFVWPTSGLALAYVYTRGNGVPATQPVLSGAGVTWIYVQSVARTNDLLSLFAADLTGSVTGAVTIDYGGVTQLACSASFLRARNVDLKDGIPNVFAQVVVAGSGLATSGTLTFAPASHPLNRPVVGVWHEAQEATTPRANWTEVDDLFDFGNVRGLETQYRSDAFETTASASWVTSSSYRLIGVEIKAFHKDYSLTADSGSFGLVGTDAPLVASSLVSVTINPAVIATSNLELSLNLVEKTLNGSSNYAAYRAAAIPNLQGMYSRVVSFIGGFGESCPLANWDGTGAVPTVNEVRGGLNVFDVGGINRFAQVATDLNVPIDWIVWRLPWQFTGDPQTGAPSVAADYYGTENRRVRLNDATCVANFKLFLRRVAKYLIQTHGARRFKIGSEIKGFQTDYTDNLSHTLDYKAYFTFYKICTDTILLAADDAGVSRSLIVFCGPYVVTRSYGSTTGALNDIVNFDTRASVTAPIQTIRYKDDAVPATWDLNQPIWGYPFKTGAQVVVEHLKLCALNGAPISMAAVDFGTHNPDSVIKYADDFLNAEQRCRSWMRWLKRVLTDLNGGQYAALKDWIDITEIYIRAQGTIVDTNNTVAGTGAKPPPALPEGYLTPAQAFAYQGAVKAIALAVFVEEGVRTPTFWSANGRSDDRTYPVLTGGSVGFADEQARYGACVIGQGVANEGSLTVIGTIFRNVNQLFGAGTRIRSVSVSDSSKIYALASDTTCMLVNKTGSSQRVRIQGGAVQTLSPYETRFSSFGTAYSMAAAAGSFALVGRDAALKVGHRLPLAFGNASLSAANTQLLFGRDFRLAFGSLASSGINVLLLNKHVLPASGGSLVLSGFNARFIRQPPFTLIAGAGVFPLVGANSGLVVARSIALAGASFSLAGAVSVLKRGYPLSAGGASFSLSGFAAALSVQRRLAFLPGSLSLSGSALGFVWLHRLVAAAGSLSLSGQGLALLRQVFLHALGSVLSMSGLGATLSVQRRLPLAAASFSLVGTDSGLVYTPANHYLMAGGVGVYALVGVGAVLLVRRRLVLQAGGCSLVGVLTALLLARLLPASFGLYQLEGQISYLNGAVEQVPDTPLDRIFVVTDEDRVLAVDFEDRVYVIS